MLTHPDAIKAMKKEWDRLRDRQVWREDLVEEWSDVKKRFGTKPVHVGDILETCTQKCDELPDTPENKALKNTRVVCVMEAIVLKTKLAKLLCFKNTIVALRALRRHVHVISMACYPETYCNRAMLIWHIARLRSEELRPMSVCLNIDGPPIGMGNIGTQYALSRRPCTDTLNRGIIGRNTAIRSCDSKAFSLSMSGQEPTTTRSTRLSSWCTSMTSSSQLPHTCQEANEITLLTCGH